MLFGARPVARLAPRAAAAPSAVGTREVSFRHPPAHAQITSAGLEALHGQEG